MNNLLLDFHVGCSDNEHVVDLGDGLEVGAGVVVSQSAQKVVVAFDLLVSLYDPLSVLVMEVLVLSVPVLKVLIQAQPTILVLVRLNEVL